MQAIAERDQREIERNIGLAWFVERLAREKILESPGEYIAWVRPKKPQSAEQMLGVFREYQAAGAPIRIRHLGPDGKELN